MLIYRHLYHFTNYKEFLKIAIFYGKNIANCQELSTACNYIASADPAYLKAFSTSTISVAPYYFNSIKETQYIIFSIKKELDLLKSNSFLS